MVSEDGPVFAVLQAGAAGVGEAKRFRAWLAAWQAETKSRIEI